MLGVLRWVPKMAYPQRGGRFSGKRWAIPGGNIVCGFFDQARALAGISCGVILEILDGSSGRAVPSRIGPESAGFADKYQVHRRPTSTAKRSTAHNVLACCQGLRWIGRIITQLVKAQIVPYAWPFAWPAIVGIQQPFQVGAGAG
jgi:hypothetical protein